MSRTTRRDDHVSVTQIINTHVMRTRMMIMIGGWVSLSLTSILPIQAIESRGISADLPSPSRKSGHAYVERASRDKRIRNWDNAVANYTRAIQIEQKSLEAHYYRGMLYRDLGNLDQALADLNVVVREEPKWLPGYLMRASIYARRSEIEKARSDYDEVIRKAVHSSKGHFFQAQAYDGKRDYPAAAAQYLRASKMSPRDSAILNGMAWLKATCPDNSIRNGREAVEIAIRSCELRKWNNWNSIDTLAAAYAETGDFSQAVKYEKKAISLNQATPYYDRKMRHSLELFQAQKPFREPDKIH